MHFFSPRLGGPALSQFTLSQFALVALGLAALAPTARAQTQDLFVSNQNNNTISRFAGTGLGTFSTIATTLSDPNGTLNAPRGLVFDTRGDLFAANVTFNSITEFAFNPASGTFGAGAVVETGLSGPSFLAFGPVPAVPEASTTVSLGLLLALGLGGTVMAARKKRKA